MVAFFLPLFDLDSGLRHFFQGRRLRMCLVSRGFANFWNIIGFFRTKSSPFVSTFFRMATFRINLFGILKDTNYFSPV